MTDSEPVNPILFLIFIVLLAIFYYVFYANPYKVLGIARIPIMILFFIVIFCLLIFIEYFAAKEIYKGSTTREMGSEFMKYAYKYFYYIFYLVAIAFVTYFLYKGVEKGVAYSFGYSFWVTIGLLILVLALVSNFTKEVSFNSPYLDLAKTIILYIPCLITDAIDYMKQDFANTPSTVWIVFCLLIVYILIFYFIPFLKKYQYKNDGILLVDKAVYLNTNVLSITSDELKDKILEKRPFYDRWFQKMMAMKEETREKSSGKSTIIHTDSSGVRIPPMTDRLTLPYYLKKLEGFTSLQNEDIQLIPFHLFRSRVTNDYEDEKTANEDIDPEKFKKKVHDYILAHPQILTMIEKLQYMRSSAFASWDTFTSIPRLLSSEDGKIHKYNYHYAITSWVYLQEIQSLDAQLIYSFGTRPSLYYDPMESSLMVILNYGTPKQSILYKTQKVLYQRWNFIVMNYRYGSLDLFINNNLVGTYPNVLTQLDPDDILLVGSKENENVGGICNMKYYELPLGVRKIDTIYKTFHNKKIPV